MPRSRVQLHRYELIACVVVVVACQGSPVAQAQRRVDARMTARYVELLQAEVSANDHLSAYNAVQCESRRLFDVLMPTRGSNGADAVIKRAYNDWEKSLSWAERRQRDGEDLPGVLYAVSDSACAEMARAGILGDSVWPPPAKFRP